MTKFRKKPIVIEAEQWFPGKEIEGLSFDVSYGDSTYRPDLPRIKTLEGWMMVSEGDYIITGINGEKYPCKPDIFEKTYDPVIEAYHCVAHTKSIESMGNPDKDGWTIFPLNMPRSGRVIIMDSNNVESEIVMESGCMLIPMDCPLRGTLMKWRLPDEHN